MCSVIMEEVLSRYWGRWTVGIAELDRIASN
jgi:hypothetical protein